MSALITGWDEELPVEAKTVTYQLSVEDAQGQRAKEIGACAVPAAERG